MTIRVLLIITLMMTIVSCSWVVTSRPKASDGYFVKETYQDSDINKRNKSVIVFIHGVIGDYKETWINRENKAIWQEIIKQDCELENFDVFVASYSTPLFKDAPTLAQLGEGLKNDLEEVISNYEYIVVVGHSMGNLVFRHAAYFTNAFDNIGNVLLLSMGAPSTDGEPFSSIATLISDNPQFRDMLELDYNSYLQALNTFQRLNPKKHIEIACAFEMQPINRDVLKWLSLGNLSFTTKVVGQAAATAVCTRPEHEGIEANHIDMVKPRDASDDIHRWLKSQLNAPLKLAHKIVLMDSPTGMYRAGTMNLTDIKNQLQKDKFKDARVIQIPTSHDWDAYRWVIEQSPDLVVIHYSGFFKDESIEKDRAKAFELGSKNLRLFLKRVMEDTAKTKVLVYSRWHGKHHGLELGKMNNYVHNTLLGNFPEKYKRRIHVYDVNNVEVPPDELNFNNNLVFGELQDKIITILTGGKNLVACK